MTADQHHDVAVVGLGLIGSGALRALADAVSLAERALSIGLPVVEDNPYGDLWFDNPPSPQARAALQDQP